MLSATLWLKLLCLINGLFYLESINIKHSQNAEEEDYEGYDDDEVEEEGVGGMQLRKAKHMYIKIKNVQ